MKMKFIVVLMLSITLKSFSQNPNTIVSFKVYGNCGMCKQSIEKALQIESIKACSWNPDSKLLRLKFDERLISLDSLHKRIVAIGYDTDKYKANDLAYDSLHKCCKYERKK